MLGRLRKLLGIAPVVKPGERSTAAAEERWTLRRWEAAETNRLNSAQWQKVTGQSINQDLSVDLEPLRTRAEWELSRNPTLEGVVKTFCDDVVGENGPGLQAIASDDDQGRAYVRSLERVVAAVFEDIDAAGQRAMADVLRMGLRSLWTAGEFLEQILTDPAAAGPIAIRLKSIAARRLLTPPAMVANGEVTLGVRRNALGRPTGYFLAEFQPMANAELYTGRYIEVPAADLVHEFVVLESGQARGVPWLATSLQPMSDLREYDAQVLDAARQAADWAIGLYTDHPDADYIEVNEVTEVERRQIQTMPPGWKPYNFTPPQPATNYVDYRAERQRDVGRPAGMPLMTVRLDSSKHNYSSARFDAQVYRRGINSVRGWLRRRFLNRLVEVIRREAELYALANPQWEHAVLAKKPAGGVSYRWTWQGFPHVDDEKEANGQRMRMEDGTLTFSDACLENGQDPDAVIEQLKKDAIKLEAAGITPPWKREAKTTPLPRPGEIAPEVEEDKENQNEGDEDEAGTVGNPKPKPSKSPPAKQESDEAPAVDAYGVAVRAGAVTPQQDDEAHFREQLGLPPMSEAAKSAWAADEGVRRPITLASVADTRSEPAGEPPAKQETDDATDQPARRAAPVRRRK